MFSKASIDPFLILTVGCLTAAVRHLSVVLLLLIPVWTALRSFFSQGLLSNREGLLQILGITLNTSRY